MRPCWIVITVLLASSRILASDQPSVTLGKALAVLERAHGNHDEAEHFCGIENKHELDWRNIEKKTRELANTQPEPKASDMFEVLSGLRAARQALFRDFLACTLKGPDREAALVEDAMDSLDDAAEDVEKNIQGSVKKLEGVAAYCEKHCRE